MKNDDVVLKLAAAVTPTPILQANPAWGKRTGGSGHRKLQDYEIKLFRCVVSF